MSGPAWLVAFGWALAFTIQTAAISCSTHWVDACLSGAASIMFAVPLLLIIGVWLATRPRRSQRYCVRTAVVSLGVFVVVVQIGGPALCRAGETSKPCGAVYLLAFAVIGAAGVLQAIIQLRHPRRARGPRP